MKLLVIKNINNKKLPYEVDLDYTVYIKNCSNMHLIFNSKFNKLIVENSSNIYIEIINIVTSIEINNSNYIFVKINNNEVYNVPCIELYKSIVYLIGDISIYCNILIMSQLSLLFNIEVSLT